ncbi:putative AP2-endonuclease [Acaryochloris phage A-HIS1]|nr:putative AP2-endonuclease [Acaryochloris phage A-HIS1]
MNKRPVYYNENKTIAWTFTPKRRKVIVSYVDRDLIENHSISDRVRSRGSYPAFYVKSKAYDLHKAVQKRIGFEGFCDHINRDKGDCRRENLRKSDTSRNCHNQGMQRNNTSGFLGVSWNKRINKWVANIWVKTNGKSKGKHLGTFTDPVKAALAYDEAARKYHGPHSTTNESLGNY